MSVAHAALTTHLMCPLMFCPYIRVGLQVLFLLRFHKALWLLQFSFSYASTNFSFKEIIRDSLTTLDFSVSFCNSNLVCIAFSMFLFVAMFLSIFRIESFFFFLRVRSSLVGGVLVMMLQAASGILSGLGASH